jgi:tripartite-type tricarboxylate transporter receptor subunit TctC
MLKNTFARTTPMRRIAAVGAAFLLGVCSWSASAQQAYPNKIIRWIVPYNAGGASDVVARVIGEGLGDAMGQKVMIDNKPGAGGTVGTQMLANSAPDGYTIVTADNGGLYNNWFLFEKLRNTPDSFEYGCMTGRFPRVLAVSRSVPATNFKEWQQWAKQNSDKAMYGTPGVGSPHHIAMATLEDMLGLEMQHVPYKGDSAAVVDLLGGRIQSMFMGVATASQYMKDERIRFMAVNWSSRLRSMPEVPTMDEVGIKNFDVSAEQGILMPAGTPKAVVDRFNAELAKVMQTPAVRDKLETLGMYPVTKTPGEFKAYVDVQRQKAGDIIKRKGITIN